MDSHIPSGLLEPKQKRARTTIIKSNKSNQIPNVLVTGASGYIGAAVACAFRAQGFRVFGLIREKAQGHELVKNEVIPVIGDLSKPATYESFVRKSSIIVNNAVDWGDPNWPDTWKKLYDTAVNSCTKPKAKMFIETSSPGILIYGNNPGKVLDETSKTNEEQQKWKDLEDKLLASEQLIGVVVRAGFAYGKAGGLTHNLFQIEQKDEIVISKGKENVQWSWVHIDDLSDAYVKITEAWSEVSGEVFNIAGDESPKWLDLRMRTARRAGFKGRVVTGEADDDHWTEFLQSSVVVDSSKARTRLGWKPCHIGFLAELDTYFFTWREYYSV